MTQGIQNLAWKFYIIWTVLNASFVPIIYLIYPETADRSLEDIDDYYRTNPPLLVFRDKDVISSKRPEKYRVREEEEIRRHSSVDAATFRRGSRVSGIAFRASAATAAARERQQGGGGGVGEDEYEGKTEAGDYDQERVYHKEDV